MMDHVCNDIWVPVAVAADRAQQMEAYWQDARIQVVVCDVSSDHTTYAVRAGMDLDDTMYYALRTWGDYTDPPTVNAINLMMLLCTYAEPRYVYEIEGRRLSARIDLSATDQAMDLTDTCALARTIMG